MLRLISAIDLQRYRSVVLAKLTIDTTCRLGEYSGPLRCVCDVEVMRSRASRRRCPQASYRFRTNDQLPSRYPPPHTRRLSSPVQRRVLNGSIGAVRPRAPDTLIGNDEKVSKRDIAQFHSISSSAVATNTGGTERPSASAVLRLSARCLLGDIRKSVSPSTRLSAPRATPWNDAPRARNGLSSANFGHDRGRDRRLGVDHSMPAGDVRSLG